MCYLKEYKLEIKLNEVQCVKRKCPKCNKVTSYINSNKFRVNANKENIDIWIIYLCEKCKKAWNIPVYERINHNSIDKEQYELFMNNDKELAKKYGVRMSGKNKVNDKVANYYIEKVKVREELNDKDLFIIDIINKSNIKIRTDKLLAENFNMSRSKVKSMIDLGKIFTASGKLKASCRLENGERIYIMVE